MDIKEKLKVRCLKDGDWFWLNKKIINEYAPKVKAIGITVYNFLASLADRNQFCYPSQKYIAESLGYNRSTINKVLKRLENHGLILKVKKSPKSCGYFLLEINTCIPEETNVSPVGNRDVSQVHTNKNNITRIINKKGIINNSISFKRAFKEIQPKNRFELLALDIAVVLNDYKNFYYYLEITNTYPESILRRILGEVKEIPDNRIKTSRVNIFKFLIKQYDQKNKDNNGNQSGS